MNTIYNTDSLYERFIELATKDDNTARAKGQLLKFYIWLYNHNFLKNLSKFDYEYLIDDDFNYLPLPILRNFDIAIGIDVWENYCRVGIDPSNCFNKTRQCSIVARFPLSKREEKKFYALLDKILDKKSTFSREWFDQASSSWFGEFATFGNV